eukprot:COSAG05_NODE_16345_length_348_cov_0.779116_1_plen_48_part_10
MALPYRYEALRWGCPRPVVEKDRRPRCVEPEDVRFIFSHRWLREGDSV